MAVTTDADTKTWLPDVHLHVGGERLRVGSDGSYEHVNPVTGKSQGTVPLAGSAEIDAAVAAAQAAFPAWRALAPGARRDLLIALGEALADRSDELAHVIASETGTPVRIGAALVAGTREWCLYYAGWADKIDGAVHNSFPDAGNFAYSQPEPYGVVGVIFPWNNPISSLGMKVIPALAAGNCVVVKPSELAPFVTEFFARVLADVGFPSGVVSVLPGTAAAGDALVTHPDVKKISFTGGPATARKIMAACAGSMKPSVMELGGKSPYIVFDDADLDRVADTVTRSMTVLTGQACVMGSRIIVQDTVYEELLTKLAARASAVVPGDPLDPDTAFGPVISADACERILGVIERARASGGVRVVSGGKRIGGAFADGFFIQPTVIADADPDAEIAQQETFGPVVTAYRFKDENEAVALANQTSFGLGAYLQTADIARVHRVVAQIESGGVYVNGGPAVLPNLPFGGIGESGYGREGGRAGLDEFLRLRTVTVGATR